MHLVETYALNCGLKIDKPYIYEKFFPLDIENFITLHPNSKYGSKCYDYWQDVVDILLPRLEENGIKILQIGMKDDRPLKGCLHAQGKSDINQTAYILSKSTLHLGADSFPAHVASGYGKKIVCLYSNNYAANCDPYWTVDEDKILLEPDRGGKKPTFAAEESPKTINTINPEDIAEGVLKLLNIKSNKNFKTIKKGAAYNHAIVELVPNCVADISSIGIDSIIVRMDLEFNEQILAAQLSKGKCSIITDKPIDLNILKQLKHNIVELVYLVDENHRPEFIKTVFNLGFKIVLMSELPSKKLEPIKIDYMDFGIIQEVPYPEEEELKELKSYDFDKIYYKSKRILISNAKSYKGEAAWRSDIPCDPNSNKPIKAIDSTEFWDAVEEFYILEKTS